jgi:predicted nucleic acid-binding protein
VIRGLTLDTGALIALERGDRRMRGVLATAAARNQPLTIPAPVVGEAWRGGHATWLNDLVSDANVEPTDLALAKAAGELQARTGTNQLVDAIVVASAARRADIVVTSDPHDIRRLADEYNRVVGVFPI